ncbi:phage/plasmid primase, P4 family [Dysgonomonas sp. 520]|uniref:DNA primase family protein n=1 Tax=Dysgonomonas sp. 520 TaxID=2302931 RepID=UPI0013D3E1F0|nr:phage/plasmid primase, P4 family [Dysgonomonas sp. 520]NDW08228.1 DNA primase [Dysgonomonas sp. 520]
MNINNLNNMTEQTLNLCRSNDLLKYNNILEQIINQSYAINFREIANLKGSEKTTSKIYEVVTINELLKHVRSLNSDFATSEKQIYSYNGAYWEILDRDVFKIFLGDFALQIGVPPVDAMHYRFKDKLLEQFSSSTIKSNQKSNNETTINLKNGTFYINEKSYGLRDFDKTDFLKYQLQFEYNPEAECPIFQKYLNEVLPDKDLQNVLAEYVGYVFAKHLKYEAVAILLGSGANGKSVFFDVLNALLGKENISNYSLRELAEHKSYQRGELENVLLNYSSEMDTSFDFQTFKQLVSGEEVGVRGIYRDPKIMRDYGRLMFNTNTLPSHIEQTDAIYRRLLPIPFNTTIPKEKQDKDLAKKIIKHELSGVFNWALDGMKRLLDQDGFTESKIIEDEIQEFKKDSNPVAIFIEEKNYRPSISKTKLLKTLFDEYQVYCKTNGYISLSSIKFHKMLKSLGYKSKRIIDGNIIYIE